MPKPLHAGACLCQIAIELTNACQLHCSKCWSQSPVLRKPRVKGFMNKDLYLKILDDIITTCREDVHAHEFCSALSYAGEATLHPNFKEFAELFRATGIDRRQIATNGLLLNTEKRRQVVLDNFREIAVSIHNVHPELSVILQNLRVLKQQRDAMKNPPYLRANMVLEEFPHRTGFDKAVEAVQKMGVELKIFSAITENMSRYMDDSRMVPPVCSAVYTYMGILWNGDVVPCCHMLSTADWNVGNVREHTLHEVFNGEGYKRLRMSDYAGSPCEGCTIRC